MDISVHILTKDSEKHLDAVLTALKPFKEVLIVDSGSSDRTLEIAAKFANVRLISTTFTGFGAVHNFAAEKASHDWILAVDSDEVLEETLVQEILQLSLKSHQVYSFERKNFYKGVWVKWCGWSPDRQVRLYHRRITSFNEALVHEAVIRNGVEVVALKGAAHHYPYEKVSDFLRKMQHYSDLFAQQYQGRRQSSLFKAMSHGAMAFFKSYVLKRGFLGGQIGFFISLYNAHTAYYKYMKLLELNQLSNQKEKNVKGACFKLSPLQSD